jgi:hypothetical protein
MRLTRFEFLNVREYLHCCFLGHCRAWYSKWVSMFRGKSLHFSSGCRQMQHDSPKRLHKFTSSLQKIDKPFLRLTLNVMLFPLNLSVLSQLMSILSLRKV